MDFLRQILDNTEAHYGLFVALGAIAGILTGIGTTYLHYRGVRHQRDENKERAETLAKEKEALSTSSTRTITQLQGELKGSQQKKIDLANAGKKLMNVRDGLLAELAEEKRNHAAKLAQITNSHIEKASQLSEQIHEQKEIVSGYVAEEQRREKLLKRIMKLEGQLWASRPLRSVPAFKPLHDRKTAIVSVVNLKGGVGKTTITAYLGAAFAAKGYRVLMVDLDLQGSLTSLFLSHDRIGELGSNKKLLQHYLGHVANGSTSNIRHYIHPVLEGTGSGILPTSDKLAYSELNLTLNWLLRIGNKDTRFLLRRPLHQKRITQRYDIVLLDCPPLINACCMNALTASDYVLIPVVPTQNSAERVRPLLKVVKEISARVSPAIQVAGVLCNRTRTKKLEGPEQDVWDQLLESAGDLVGVPVHGFSTCVPTRKEVRVAEQDDFVAPAPATVMYDVFHDIANELESRLPNECRRVLTCPQQHEPIPSGDWGQQVG